MTTRPAPAVFISAPEETRFQGLEGADADAGAKASPAAPNDIPLESHAERCRPRRAGIPVLHPVWRTLRQLGYASIFYGVRLHGQFPSRLLASPSDMWPGDAEAGTAMAEGLYRHQGFETSGDIPDFTDPDLPKPLKDWLHSFVWLRDLATVEDIRKARALAEPALQEWLLHYSRWDKEAWAPEVLGQRLMSLINHAPLVLASKDLVYRSKVLNALARQGRHLARTLDLAPPGLLRIRAATGLVFSSLLLPAGESRVKIGNRVLERELASALRADGSAESRNPEDLVSILELLITLRDGYRAARKTPPTYLQVTIDKAAATLRGVRLRGQGLAAFNGARHGQQRSVQHCLDMSESKAAAQLFARQGGYQRLEGGLSDVVMDTGLAPIGALSKRAHAGALAFEFAHDGAALIVNCGAPSHGVDHGLPANALRATAAHSTLVINDTNTARIKDSGEIGRTANTLRTGRDNTAAGQGVRARSDAYAKRYGYMIERSLWLANDGLCLEGIDCASAKLGKPPSKGKDRRLDIRFHLHPGVDVTQTGDANGALLRLSNGSWWRFRAEGGDVSVEPSVYVSAQSARARPSQQIVVTLALGEADHVVRWSLQHGPSAPMP